MRNSLNRAAVDRRPATGPGHVAPLKTDIFLLFCVLVRVSLGYSYSRCERQALPIIISGAKYVATPERGKKAWDVGRPIPHIISLLKELPMGYRIWSNGCTDPVSSTGHRVWGDQEVAGPHNVTLQRFAVETHPRQGLITDYNGLQLVVRRQHSGTMCYNPLLRNRKVIIGCRTFHDLLMAVTSRPADR